MNDNKLSIYITIRCCIVLFSILFCSTTSIQAQGPYDGPWAYSASRIISEGSYIYQITSAANKEISADEFSSFGDDKDGMLVDIVVGLNSKVRGASNKFLTIENTGNPSIAFYISEDQPTLVIQRYFKDLGTVETELYQFLNLNVAADNALLRIFIFKQFIWLETAQDKTGTISYCAPLFWGLDIPQANIINMQDFLDRSSDAVIKTGDIPNDVALRIYPINFKATIDDINKYLAPLVTNTE